MRTRKEIPERANVRLRVDKSGDVDRHAPACVLLVTLCKRQLVASQVHRLLGGRDVQHVINHSLIARKVRQFSI